MFTGKMYGGVSKKTLELICTGSFQYPVRAAGCAVTSETLPCGVWANPGAGL